MKWAEISHRVEQLGDDDDESLIACRPEYGRLQEVVTSERLNLSRLLNLDSRPELRNTEVMPLLKLWGNVVRISLPQPHLHELNRIAPASAFLPLNCRPTVSLIAVRTLPLTNACSVP